MDNSKYLVAIVAILVVLAGIGAILAFNSNEPEPKDSAIDYANEFLEDYNGVFGEFSLADGSNDSKAILTSIVDKYALIEGNEEVQTNSFTILYFDNENDAKTEFIEIKNSVPTSYSMTKIQKTVDSTSGYDCDEIHLVISSRNVADKNVSGDKTYSQINGVIRCDNVIIDFSQAVPKGGSPPGNVRLYYGLPIEPSGEAGKFMSVADFEAHLKTFLNAIL